MADRDQIVGNIDVVAQTIDVIASGLGGPAQTILQRIVAPSLQLTQVWLQTAPRTIADYERLWEATQRVIDAADSLMEAAAAKPPEATS